MADIIRRPEVYPSIPATWDPFRVMREMMNWEPFQVQGGLVPFAREGGFIPSFEVKETKDSFVFKADLPGVKESDVEISLTGNRLTITGKREAERKEEGESYYAFECSYGSFSRTFTIPIGCDPDHVNASLENGVLTLVVPKKPETQPKRIGLKGLVEKAAEKLKA
ncbi:Hsp20/alpha crystallin family protein [Cystobacter fuscus]|uniref:Hsp20/alpha crystallin family protein n=1 Tax=Cystobacter fuscus TaxID=43 RepID=UPI002B30FCD7|nr:Hsp20/alpha crystallin family protein [Cystobacter fuscus]